MKARKIASLCLVVSLLLSFGGPTLAQTLPRQDAPPGAEPDALPPQAQRTIPDRPPISTDALSTAAPESRGPQLDAAAPPIGARLALNEPAAPNVPAPSGEPGLSFRYLATFGTPRTGYIDDTTHLTWPMGVWAGGDRVWVADAEGIRAIQFDSNGQFISQIGKTTWRGGIADDVDNVVDTAIDGAGNVWVIAGNNQVLKLDPSGKKLLQLGQAWNSGTDNTHFADPLGVAFDAAGNVYVSDGRTWGNDGNQRIQVFDSAGKYKTTIGQTGVAGSAPLHFNGPRHIAIYDNLLYVPESGNQRVQIIDISNPMAPVYVASLGVTGESGDDNAHFSWPSGVAVNSTYIFVADTWNQRVQVFNRATRAYVRTLGGSGGQGNNQFDGPHDVAVDAAGNLYVADRDNNRVQQFNAAFAYARTYGTTGAPYATDDAHYHLPAGIAVAPNGDLLVGEHRGHRVIRLNSSGGVVWSIGTPGFCDVLCGPQAIALDAAGRIYVVNGWNSRVTIHQPDGSLYATLGRDYGAGDDEFKGPSGIAIDHAGRIIVADEGNHRVQIFNPDRAYLATIGSTGQPGSDNAHFDSPRSVAVDSQNNIYVTDSNNHRVQVFNSALAYVRTVGVTGKCGGEYDHLCSPRAVAVDEADRLYVSDDWGSRVRVFDTRGRFLATVAESGGAQVGQVREAWGMAVSGSGTVYLADALEHQVQLFGRGTPGWRQVNVNGFGDAWLESMTAFAPFDGSLYAAAGYRDSGGHIWRMDSQGAWSPITVDGFGDPGRQGFEDLAEFGGKLYATAMRWDNQLQQLSGGEIWRAAPGGSWTKVVSGGFGNPLNAEIYPLTSFGNMLYATTWSYTNTHGLEIWRSATGDSGDWARVVDNGFGDVHNYSNAAMTVFGGQLYASTWNGMTGGEVWASSNGTAWSQVNTDGFGATPNSGVASLAVFGNALYAGTSNWNSGAEIWRCTTCAAQSDWTRVMSGGFDKASNTVISTLVPYKSALYALTSNSDQGLEVWRSTDGSHWERVADKGFGNSNNAWTFGNHSAVTWHDRLYIGTQTKNNSGGQIWVKTLSADFTATPRRGPAPLTVQFTNTSAGDFTTSEWDFGDGAKSTAANPSHTYTQVGTYAVKLTISDGTDSSEITKPAYVDTRFPLYLPMLMKLSDVYDDFNDATWNGSFNPSRWTVIGHNAITARQHGGALVITNTSLPGQNGGGLRMVNPAVRNISQVGVLEARLKLGSDHQGGWQSLQIFLPASDINGHTWWTQCYLGAGSDRKPSLSCSVNTDNGSIFEYGAGQPAAYDTWYTARIEMSRTTAHIRFYLDGKLIGEHTPNEAAVLVAAKTFRPEVSVWISDDGTSGTRYVDDVRITPVR